MGLSFNLFHTLCTPRETLYLEEDNDSADEDVDALEKISQHVDKGWSHTGIGLLSPPSWKKVVLVLHNPL